MEKRMLSQLPLCFLISKVENARRNRNCKTIEAESEHMALPGVKPGRPELTDRRMDSVIFVLQNPSPVGHISWGICSHNLRELGVDLSSRTCRTYKARLEGFADRFPYNHRILGGI